jgi:HJR/Mrr/RecB family endonuclease
MSIEMRHVDANCSYTTVEVRDEKMEVIPNILVGVLKCNFTPKENKGYDQFSAEILFHEKASKRKLLKTLKNSITVSHA